MKAYTYRYVGPSCTGPFKAVIRRTRGAFSHWTPPMGIACVPYAVFRNRASEVLIPQYDLTPETLDRIRRPKEEVTP